MGQALTVQVIRRITAASEIDMATVEMLFKTKHFCVNKSQGWLQYCPQSSCPLRRDMPGGSNVQDDSTALDISKQLQLLDCYWVVTHRASGWAVIRMKPGGSFKKAREACKIIEQLFGGVDLTLMRLWDSRRKKLANDAVKLARSGVLNITLGDNAYLRGEDYTHYADTEEG